MKNKLLISTALAAAFTVANAYAVEPAQSAVSDVKNWNDNIYELEENTSRGGGVLRPAADEKDLTAGKIGDNRITARQTSGHSGEVYAQGAVLWLGKKLSSVNAGEISNNGLNVTTENNNNAKATANGGAFAIYKGGYIDNLTANFTGNKASSRYTGEGEYNGTGSSAGGGAIHVEGQYGTDEKTGIREINGNFTGNGAEGAAYANGGAIYFKAGADRDGQTGTGLVTTTINGNFADNFVKAVTANAAAKASTGGAISVKRKDGKTVDLTLNGSFTNNRVETNATEALGGALYSEGMITLGNNTVFSGNSATSTTGKAFGGANDNTADATLKISNAVFSGNYTDNAGISLRWFRDVFGDAVQQKAEAAGLSVYDYMNTLAEKVPAGCNGLVYLPYLAGEKSPIWDSDARGVFFGMSLSTDYGAFVRAIMEGVALSMRDCMEIMPAAKKSISPIPLGGGAANSRVWCQIFADVLNRPIVRLKSGETETLGDFIIAAESVGLTDVTRDFGKKLAAESEVLYPDSAAASVYDKAYQKYKAVYQNTKTLF